MTEAAVQTTTGKGDRRATLLQKVLLVWQAAVLAAVGGYWWVITAGTLRRIGAGVLILAALLLAVVAWSHFMARPHQSRPAGRRPHFSYHVGVGILILFLGVVGMTTYYADGVGQFWILGHQWWEMGLPADMALLQAYGVVSLAWGVRVG